MRKYLDIFRFQWFPNKFTEDYLAKYVIGADATKIKLFHPDYYDKLNVLTKMVKDEQTIITCCVCLPHGGGPNISIPPIHLHQQPECILPLSLPSLMLLWFLY